MGFEPLLRLALADAQRLEDSLAGGLLSINLTRDTLNKTIPGADSQTCEFLLELAGQGWKPSQLAQVVRAIRESQITRTRESHLIELVLSGPEVDKVPTRDTAAVFNELITSAEHHLLLASYAIYNGTQLLAPLADKLELEPEFDAELYLDIPRSRGDTTMSEHLVALYRKDFLERQWPKGKPMPRLYHYHPALDQDWKSRGSMHAKIVVADHRRVFLSSANFTGAAQLRNLEVGLAVESSAIANRLVKHYHSLNETGLFRRF